MQATIDIDAKLYREAEELARRKGQAFSTLVEQSLLKTLQADQRQSKGVELYGEPLSDEEIGESARVAFRALDEDEDNSKPR